MKNVLKFSGIIAFVLGLVGFILMMATNAVVYDDGTLTGWYAGMNAIFASGKFSALGAKGYGEIISNFNGTLAWNALLAWIFALVALIIVCAGVVLPLLKIKALEKFSGVLNLVAIGLFAVAGVFLFFTVPAFAGANDWNGADGWGLGAGWVIGAILYLVAAGFAALPVVGQILKK